MSDLLLEVKHLKKYFPIQSSLLKRKIGDIRALDDVSFTLKHGESIGIVGESGCGKSTLAKVLMKVYEPTGDGQIVFDGQDITHLGGPELQKHRRRIQMIFQDPQASLNPKMRVRDIVAEPLFVNGVLSKAEAKKRAVELLEMVGLGPGDAAKYPGQFSGGQRQRVGIARAIALRPKLIVADEPTSALDASIQAQILNLMMELKRELGLSYLFISHNLAAVKHISDKVGVMYLGNLVELSPRDELYEKALHPYTKALLSIAPVADIDHRREQVVLTGDVPSPANPPSGCRFHTRCPECFGRCKEERPKLIEVSRAHWVACHLYDRTGGEPDAR